MDTVPKPSGGLGRTRTEKTVPAVSAAVPGGRRRRRGRWIPPQHGAWAMLLLPYLAGLLTAGAAWPVIPLLVAWISGYLLSYFALLAVKTRRPARFRRQLLVYGLSTLTAGAVVLAARPQLIVYGPAFALALGVNGYFAARHNDRALANGLASALAATLILPVTAEVAGSSPRDVAGTFTVVLLYLAGTVLFVKTCIRERENRTLLRASVAFHAAALAVAVWTAAGYAVAFGWYLLRAGGLPRRRMSPAYVGAIEVASSLLLLVCVALV